MARLATTLRAAVISVSLTAMAAGSGAALAASTQPGGSAAGPDPAFVPGRVLVHYAPGATTADEAAVEHANGASRVGEIRDLGVTILQVPDGAEQRVVDAMQHSTAVDYAEVDGVVRAADVTPDDPLWPQQWGLSKIDAPAAWTTTEGASSVVVADLDTGVDLTQPDLQGRFTAGYDFVNNDADPSDDNGHGTETSGIIGATADNGLGVAGVCWKCMVMPVKVLDSSAAGSWSQVASGITWATDHGAAVISMSLAGSSGGATIESAVSYALDHDVVVVAAAGNYGSSTPEYPAAYPGVLSVAGSTSNDSLYSWSDYGSWVDVAAPGCEYTTQRDTSYVSFCGTSASTPVVAGVAGLARSADPAATATQVASALEASAVSLSGVSYGRIDAAATLAGLSAGTTTSASPTPSPSASPTPSPSDSPTPSSSPSPGTATSTFSGSLNNKTASRSYSINAGAGAISAALTFSKTSSMSLAVEDGQGNVIAASTSGSPVALTTDSAGGPLNLVVSGANRGTFSLSVTYPSG